MRFQVNKGKAETAPMFSEPSVQSRLLINLEPDTDVEANGSADGTPDWAAIAAPRFVGDQDPTKGWIEKRFLTASEETASLEIDEESFVRTCVRVELNFNSRENADPFPIVADYLLAVSMIEADMTNAAADSANDGAGGPFAITDTEWASYLNSGASDAGATNEIRIFPNMHAFAAAFLAQDQMRQFSKLNTKANAPDGPYVPSYLNVLHCQLFGVEVASKFNELATGGQGDSRADEVLKAIVTDPAKQAKLLARRRKHLFDGSNARTVEVMFVKTANLLNERLLKANRLIKEHVPEVIPPQETLSGGAPWFSVAEEQLVLWKDGNLVAAAGEGRRKVIEYFTATDSGITTVEPWCGAFVAFCLSQAGIDAAAKSIVSGSAQAARWKSWGNTELRLRARNTPGEIPKGAVVVTVPLAQGASGHVGFFSRHVDAERIEILGGNQSNRISLMTLKRSRIVAIRWCDFTPQISSGVPSPTVTGSPVLATDNDVLILARTLYGEARGEPIEGIEAVANVIMNRVGAARPQPTVSAVCLKPFQFSCWNRNDPNFSQIKNKQPGNDAQFDKCLDIARKAVTGNLTNHVGEARHYYANYIPTPSWVHNSPRAKLTFKIGAHLFYANIK